MKLEEILKNLEESKEICFDFETVLLHHKLLTIDGISFTSEVLEPVFIRYSNYDPVELRAFMKEAFSLPAVYIGHNLMFDCKILKYFYGITLEKKFDTMVAAWYLDENRLKGLKDLSEIILGQPMRSYNSFVKEYAKKNMEKAINMAIEELGDKAKKKDIKQRAKEINGEMPVDNSWLDDYGSLDAKQTYKLYKIFKPQLEAEKLDTLFYDLEMPFLDVLIDMTLIGIDTDSELLEEMRISLTEKQTILENKIYNLIGEFNIGSTAQLSEKLYGIKVTRKGGVTHLEDVRESGRDYVKPVGFTKKGAPSTDKDSLEKLPDSELVSLIRGYKDVAKLLNTYAVGYLKFVVDGKIYPNFNGEGRDEDDGGTLTGRLSCAAPNMMNLPRERKEGEIFIKDAFFAPEGYDLIVTDESQLELRILAHVSNAVRLIAAFLSGEDIHRKTAQEILSREEVTEVERSSFKRINFAIIYGMSSMRLAEEIGVSEKEAEEYLRMYFNVYGGVKEWMEGTLQFARKWGYVRTLIGRKRRLPDIWSSNYGFKSHAERQAINSVVQGSASDILKLAMLKINDQFKIENLDAHIQLQIHDELVVLSKNIDTERACDIIQTHMENPFAVPLKVPLVAIPKVVKKWGEAK
jgi:DNA polymerase-1